MKSQWSTLYASLLQSARVYKVIKVLIKKIQITTAIYFPVFALNTDIYSVNFQIQSNTEKYWPEKLWIRTFWKLKSFWKAKPNKSCKTAHAEFFFLSRKTLEQRFSMLSLKICRIKKHLFWISRGPNIFKKLPQLWEHLQCQYNYWTMYTTQKIGV